MNRKIIKVPLKSNALRDWLKVRNTSIVELSRRVKVNEKTIRRSLESEEITHDLGYMISVALKVDPYEFLDLESYIDKIISQVRKD